MCRSRLPHFAVLFVAMVLSTTESALQIANAAEADKFLVFVGTYTSGESEGIYSFRFDAATGRASDLKLAARATNPAFLAIHPDGRHLYAVREANGTGAVGAFALDPESGTLEELTATPTGGAGPCHLVVDATGRYVLAANYGGGSVCSISILDDGRVGEMVSFIQHEGSSVNPQRQTGPHAHSVNLSPDNRFAFVADLGLDKVLIYRFDSETGKLTPNDPPDITVAPGSGPRHFAFHPSGRFAYVINEILLTVTAMRYDSDHGRLEEIQTTSTIPVPVRPEFSTAEVVVHPSGKFLYGSNRGHDTIAIFQIDEQSGTLSPRGHEPTRGRTPRNFAVDPTGRYLFAENQDSGTIVIFRINSEDGTLQATGDVLEVPSPVCIKFVANRE